MQADSIHSPTPKPPAALGRSSHETHPDDDTLTYFATPHDKMLSTLYSRVQREKPSLADDFSFPSRSDVGIGDESISPASPRSVMLSSPSPPLGGAFNSTLFMGASRESAIQRETLTDPYDGTTLGILVPNLPFTDANSDLSGDDDGASMKRNEELWSHLSRITDLQTEIARMHMEMEGIGLGKGKGKLGESKVRGRKSGDGGRQSHSDGGPEECDVEWEGVEMDDEETEQNRAREEEFAKLADQFEGRKDSINNIMNKLDDLSKALTEFHALQAPEVKMPPNRQDSNGLNDNTPPSTHKSPQTVHVSKAGVWSPPNSAVPPSLSRHIDHFMAQKLLDLPPITPELKSLLPFLQRADEVKLQEPIIAYWCAYYAAQLGIAARAVDTPSRQVLSSLLDTLERMKKEIGSSDVIDDEAASCAYVENFALRVFSFADNEDRKGNATRATAKKFLAAANFLELLHTFPKTQLSDNVDEKIRYAKWKAADIAKAFREGRKPMPGPPGTTEVETAIASPNFPLDIQQTMETSVPTEQAPEISSTDAANDIDSRPRNAWVSGELEGQPSPVAMTPPPMPPKPFDSGLGSSIHFDAVTPPSTAVESIPHLPHSPQWPPAPSSVPTAPPYLPSSPGFQPAYIPPVVHPAPPPPPPPSLPSAQLELTPSLVVRVQKHCRYAISALDYEDADTARKELRSALALLEG